MRTVFRWFSQIPFRLQQNHFKAIDSDGFWKIIFGCFMDVFFLKLFLEKPFKQHLSLIRTFEIRIFEKSKQTESSSRGRSEVKGAGCFENFISLNTKKTRRQTFMPQKNQSPEPRKKNQESVSFVDFFNGNLRFLFVHLCISI